MRGDNGGAGFTVEQMILKVSFSLGDSINTETYLDPKEKLWGLGDVPLKCCLEIHGT